MSLSNQLRGGDVARVELGPVGLWRLSAWLYRHDRRLLARVVKLVNYLVFHTILPPEATMTKPPHLMHNGLGVVIHPTTQFGEGVWLGHNVTVAASPVNAAGEIFPVIFEDRAFVGAGAILIARTGPLRIGEGAVVAAGSVVLHDVPPGGKVYGNPAKPAERPGRSELS